MKIKGIEQIKGIVADIRAKYPRITDEMLLDNGKITYANGNDSTAFDWSWNDCLSEFMVYHNDGTLNMGFIKVRVNKDGTIDWYVYPNGEMKPTESGELKAEFSVAHLKDVMMKYADNKHLYDKTLDVLFGE